MQFKQIVFAVLCSYQRTCISQINKRCIYFSVLYPGKHLFIYTSTSTIVYLNSTNCKLPDNYSCHRKKAITFLKK